MVVERPQPSCGAIFDLLRLVAWLFESGDTSLYRRVMSFTRRSTAGWELSGSRSPGLRHS